ncbi:MAG: hypothetical protein IKJ82_08070 [Oscillospiraceae bacterium]|nr:hypothetical protein [Oscillospiraceae bacterium]
MDFNLTSAQQNAILEAASKKLGISREKLENAAKHNDLGVFGNIAAPKIQHYANDPKELERFLSDPKNQAIIKKLIGGG